MSLPHALLGLINYHPATGYDLKTAFDTSIHFFWNATLPQIYRTLKQMEADGWVTSTVEHQDGKPSKKIYSVTGAGRSEFKRWLAEPPEAVELRNPMLVKIFFGNRMSREQFRDQLRRWREFHAGMLARLEKEVDPVIVHYAKLTGAPEDAYYWRLTVDFGKRHAQMVIDWCDRVSKARKAKKKNG
jgi:PadR family transcriptional regulator, regulatory protein AphA